MPFQNDEDIVVIIIVIVVHLDCNFKRQFLSKGVPLQKKLVFFLILFNSKRWINRFTTKEHGPALIFDKT